MGKGSKNPKKVLILDDDPLALRIVKDRLVQAGYLVSTTSSAFGAMTMVEEQVPDVVVIDVMLPSLPGDKVAALIRERLGGKVKILLYSGKSELELAELAKECGADRYLSKSDDYGRLVEEIRALAKG